MQIFGPASPPWPLSAPTRGKRPGRGPRRPAGETTAPPRPSVPPFRPTSTRPFPPLLFLLRQHLPLHLAVEAAVLAAPGPPHLPLPLLQEVAPAALLRSCRPPSPSSAELAAPPYQIVEADSEERGLAQAPHLTLLVQGVAALLPALQLCPLGQHLSTLPHQAGCTTSVHPCWPPPLRS